MRQRQPRLVSMLAALAVFVLCIPAARAAIGTFDRTLHVSGAVVLRVRTEAGSIHVTPGPAGKVRIVGHLHASGVAYGQPAAERIERVLRRPPVRRKGDSIAIDSRLGGTTDVVIDYDITAPAGTQLQASTGSGNLRLQGVGGSLKASTGQGSIHATGFTGHVWLRSGAGGGIRATLSGSNDVMAHTSDGTIRIRGVDGPLLADAGSGDIQIAGRPAGDWLVHTGYGQVALRVGKAGFDLDASTGVGSILSEAAISTHGDVKRGHVAGKVNGGGPSVRVETGAGDIRIQ